MRRWKAKYLDEIGKKGMRVPGYRSENVTISKDRMAFCNWEEIRQSSTRIFSGNTEGWNSCEYASYKICWHSRRDLGMLASAGGSAFLTKEWAPYVLQRIWYVKRKATTRAKNTVKDFDTTKLKSPPNKLRIQYIPVGDWTMAKHGSKTVPISSLGSKCQIMAILAGTASFTSAYL